jgi:hypothetical protein
VSDKPKFQDPKPKSSYEVLGLIVGAALGSAVGAISGQLFISLGVCVGLGWGLGLVAQQCLKNSEPPS